MALVDYRLLVYVRLWDLLLDSATIEQEFYEQNRIRMDDQTNRLVLVRGFDDPASFPKLAITLGPGSDSGHPAKYQAGYDGGTAVDVQQQYIVKLTFESPHELLTASPLIA